MTTGALIFGINNESIDYLSMAKWSAKNIERHLGIPTHIVTAEDIETQQGHTRWFNDYGQVLNWHNQSRVDAYDLSPWDQTLLIDADYVVASNQLKTLLDSDQEFLAHRWAYDVTDKNNFMGLNWFGNLKTPQWWATVIMFRKCKHSRLIFDAMAMIKQNWAHYNKLYHVRSPIYRNDFALSIAQEIVNGHTQSTPGIPWRLASVVPDRKLTQLATDQFRVDFETEDLKARYILLKNQDFHAMGKRDLGDIIGNPA